MDNPLGFLFGKTTITAKVVDEPPPARTSMEDFIRYRESYKGKVMRALLKRLDLIAKILLKRHDINCCSEQDTKHLKFQCGFSKEFVIMNYHWNNYIHLGFEEVEQFVLFMGASEIESFMSKTMKPVLLVKTLKIWSLLSLIIA